MLLVASLTACSTAAGLPAPGADGLIALARRPAAPHLAGAAVSGPAILADRGTGRVQVVNFWGSWCSPCRAEAPLLAAAARQFARDGVVFLGVDVKEDRASAARFESRSGRAYPSLFDKDGVVATRFRSFAPPETPTTILVDRKGRIARVLPGTVDPVQLNELIAKLVAEPAAG
jgi:thiol-disulfide isomerase/thioredoxin